MSLMRGKLNTAIILLTIICFTNQLMAEDLRLLWVQYGQANKTVKLTVHTDLDPLAPKNAEAILYLKKGETWQEAGKSKIDPLLAMAR